MSFEVHPRLAAGGFLLARQSQCQIFLKDNALFPWMLVVPEVAAGIEDLHQLEDSRLLEVMAVVTAVSRFVDQHFGPDKLNVACIGNQVRQMHLHIVGRSEGDPAWPGVVWSFGEKKRYEAEAVKSIRSAFDDWTAS